MIINMERRYVKMKIIINPDDTLVADVRKRLAENDGYCPCAFVKEDDTKCMCKSFREQKSVGECHCGLYIKIED